MTRHEVLDNARNFLAQYISEEVDDDENIFAAGLVNSLFAMQLVLFVEKEYAITVERDDLDLSNFHSLNAIADFVTRKAA